jgi:hypothetical protein
MITGFGLSNWSAAAAVVASVFFAAPAFASVGTLPCSSYSVRHQEKIVRAVEKECGAIEHVSVLKEQGIADARYQTTLNVSANGVGRVVVVTSYYSDFYDHLGRNWGAYGIESVECFASR